MRLAIAAVLSALLLPQTLDACTCVCVTKPPADSDQVRGALSQRQNAFLGRVVKVEPAIDPPDIPAEYAARVATVQVIREWKGEGRKEYKINAGYPGAGCGYSPVVGRVQLFVVGLPGGFDSCCPEPPSAELRRLIVLLDEVTGMKPVRMPRELR